MSGQKPKVIALEGNEKFQRLLAGAPETAGMKSGHVVLQPGESVGEHNTEAKEEAIIVLEGTAQVFIAGAVFCLVAGKQLIYIPPHTPHDIKNISDGPLRYVYVVKS